MRNFQMKRILLLVLAIFPVIAWAQSGTAKVKAGLKGLDPKAKAFLIYAADDKRVIDSAQLINGGFNFTVDISEPTEATVVISHDGRPLRYMISFDRVSFYLDNGVVELNGTDSISKVSVKGPSINDDYKKLQTLLEGVNAKTLALNHEYQTAPAEKKNSQEFREYLVKKDSVITAERHELILSYIKSNPQTLISLNSLKEYAGPTPDVAVIQPLFNSLSAPVKESKSGKLYGAYLANLQKTAIGSIAPDFSQPDTSGKIISLSSFRGKYILVDFWASWCGPCRAENPNVVKAYAKYHPKGFEILGVSLDQPTGKANWLKAIHADGLGWTQVSDLKFWKNEVAVLYGIKAIPQNFLLDPNGKIIAKNLRGEDLNKKLIELFGAL